MSQLYNDIIKQPSQWQQCLDYTLRHKHILVNACEQLMSGQRVILVAIGASYNAGLAIKHMLDPWHPNVSLVDASEFMNDGKFYLGDVAVFLTRSGKSIELVKIMDMCQANQVPTIAVCNDPDSMIGSRADNLLFMNVDFDHAVSINTYTSIILIGLLIRDQIIAGTIQYDVYNKGFDTAQSYIAQVDKIVQTAKWLGIDQYYYFLGRGIDYGAACEAMLLWQEAAKMPAVAMTTGTFRHGPQEVVTSKLSVMIWVDPSSPNYLHDLTLIEDLKRHDAKVIVFGDMDDAANESELSYIRPLTNQILPQLLSMCLAQKRNVDADSFLFCNYIVQSEGGL